MKCRIHKNEPNSAQRRALKQEVAKEFNKLLERYNRDASMQINMEYTYELPEDDTPFLCELKLRESGIDVDKLFGWY